MRTPNVRMIAILAVCGLVLGVACHWLHGVQMRRHAGFFLEQARLAKNEGRDSDALNHYRQYFDIHPEDREVLAEYGILQADLSRYSQAFITLEKVIRDQPDRSDARRKLVDVLMAMGRYRDAAVNLKEYLLKASPDAEELWTLLGRCQASVGEDNEAVYSLQVAISIAPEQLDTYAHLAGLLRYRLESEEDADALMRKMVEANPKSPRAHVLLGSYLRGILLLEEAGEVAAKALQLAPDDHDALLLATRCAVDGEEYDKAREHALRLVEFHPDSASAYAMLAEIELRGGRRDEATSKGIRWVRRGLEEVPGDEELLWKLAILSVEHGEIQEAEQAAQKLSEVGHPEPVIEYLRARIEARRGDWMAASQRLEGIRPQLTTWPDMAKDVECWLASCYGNLGRSSDQLAAYRRAIAMDRLYFPARLGLATALFSADQVDEALIVHRETMKLKKAPPSGRLLLAHLLTRSVTRLDPAERDWREVEAALDAADRALPGSTEGRILRANVLVRQNRLDAAEAILKRARDEQPEQAVWWIELSSLAQWQREWDRAGQILDDAGEQLGDQASLRVARGLYLVRRHGAAAEGLDALAADVEQFSEEERLQIWRGLLAAALRADDVALAGRLCELISASEPHDLQVPLLRFNLARAAEDDSAMEAALREILQIEGKGPLWHYAQASRLVLGPGQVEKDQLKEAREHVVLALGRQPEWSRLLSLAAVIDDRMGDHKSAVNRYMKAIEMGETNPTVIRRTVYLLYQQQRYSTAYELICRLDREPAPPSIGLGRMESELRLRAEDMDGALDAAREAAKDSEDYRDHLWLGQVLSIMGLRAEADGQSDESQDVLAEAEKALRHAVELADRTPQTWVTLVHFLGRTGQLEEAEEAIAEAGKRLPADEAPVALAECYLAVGKPAEAEKQYDAALATAPDDHRVLRRAAELYLQTNNAARAEEYLRRIVTGQSQSPDVAWGRRRLALLLAARGGIRNLDAALSLIKDNLDDKAVASSSVADQRVKATVLASYPQRERRQEAIQLFESLLQTGESSSAEDRFALAQLYLAQEDWPKANEQFRSLLASETTEPRYLSAYVGALLLRKEFHEAELWLNRLEDVAPDEFSTVALRAEALFQRGQFDQVIACLKGFAEEPDLEPYQRAEQSHLVGARFEEYAQRLRNTEQESSASRFDQEAEATYRALAERHPEQELPLAAFLGREGRVDEALEVVEREWARSDLTAVVRTLPLLVVKSEHREQLQRVEKILLAALEKHERSNELLMIMAEVLTRQDRYEQTEAIYREVLRKNGDDVVAMNNLAVFLALRGTHGDESLELINRAIEIAGPVSALLDSRAMVYLAMSRPRLALADLEKAIADTPRPTRHFHRAQAYHQLGQDTAAAEAFNEAERLDLRAEVLYPLEVPAFQSLKAALK